jgi:hypothetical protein
LGNGFLDKNDNINSDKIEIIVSNYPDLNLDWLITGKGEILKNNTSIVNSSGIVIQGTNTLKDSNIDNRRYYSDSPDILKAQIDDKDKLLREKDERLREKDEYIVELKERIQELKAK